MKKEDCIYSLPYLVVALIQTNCLKSLLIILACAARAPSQGVRKLCYLKGLYLSLRLAKRLSHRDKKQIKVRPPNPQNLEFARETTNYFPRVRKKR